MSKQVFLYNTNAKLTKGDLDALREAGFVPIKVANFDDVRVIDPLMDADRNAVWMSAMEAIAKADSNNGPKSIFGRLLAERLCNTNLPATKP